MSEKTTFARWGGKLVYGGFLAFALSLLTAEWLSGQLHEFYRASMFWRDLFGEDPNKITTMMEKVSWALVFLCSWWMLWKLDSLLGFEPMPEEPAPKEETRPEEATEEEATEEKATESTVPDEGEKETTDPKESDEGQNPETDESFASVQSDPPSDPLEAGFAETLGLEKPYSEKEMKSAYRKLIAQYHPDRVSAMGPEIKEVAETKAKEINEAYEYFRNKFEQDQ